MKKINFHFVSILVLLALSLFFFNSLLHKGVMPYNIHYINDLTFLSYNTKEALSNNEFPLWTPYFYMGQPLIAIPENYMLDFNFLFIYLFRDIYLAMNLSLILYFFMAGLGMYLLVYSLVREKRAAFISAILYMLNGFMQSFMLHGHINILEGYSLIPFIFFFAYRALKDRNFVIYSILAGIFFALQILAGSVLFFFYTILALGLYFVIHFIISALKGDFKSILKLALVGFLIAITALSLSAIKLLPVLEFTKMSSRSGGVSFNEYLGEPVSIKSIASIIIRNTAGLPVSGSVGIIGFLLLIFGLASYKKKLVVFCLITIIFSLLFASGTFLAGWMYKLPGFSSMRHVERALVLFVFAGSILAAYGYVFLSEKLKRFHAYVKYEKIFFAAIIFLMLLDILLLQKVPLSINVAEPDSIKLLEYMGKDNSTFRTINLALNDIIGAAGYNYYSQKGISEVKGGGGIWINDYAAFVAVAQQSLSPKILSVLNVKYAISGKKMEIGNLTLVNRFDVCHECALIDAYGPYLYKNEHFLPRYYIVPNSILVVGDDNSATQLIYSLMFQNWQPGNTVLVKGTKINDYNNDFLNKFDAIFLVKDSVDENSIGKLREYTSQNGLLVPDILNGQNTVSSEDIRLIFNKLTGNYTEVGIKEYSNNKVALSLNGEKGWLVASERFAHFPGWEAKINNKKLDLLKADNVITALYLEGDSGILSFEYNPKSYRKGRLITLISLIGIIVYFGYFIYKKRFSSRQTESIK